MKFSIKDLFSKCDQIHGFQLIRSHLLRKSLMENIIFLCSENTYKRLLLFQSANTAIVLLLKHEKSVHQLIPEGTFCLLFFAVDADVIFLYLGILEKGLRYILIIFKFSVMIWPWYIIIAKHSILDVVTVPDPPLLTNCKKTDSKFKKSLKLGWWNLVLMNTEIRSNASK